MTLNSVWLIVLTMLPSMRRLAAWLTAPVLLLSGTAALAANNFNGGAVANCSIDAPTKTYTCGSLSLPDYNTSTSIASGYTVVVTSSVNLGFNQSLQMSGSARLQSTGNIDIGDISTSLISISGGTLAAANGDVKLGGQAQTITANVSAKTVTVGSSATKITGSVTATGAISTGSNVTINGAVTSTTGAISFGSDNTISGAVNGASISTNSNVKLSGTLSVDGAINLGSGNTISGAVSGASISTNSSVNMGALTVTGAANLGSSNTINGGVSANNIKTSSGVTVTGAIDVKNLADLGSAIKVGGGVTAGSVKTDSPGQISGGIDAKTTIDLGSGITISGNVSGTVITTDSPVNITGNISASTSLTLASNSTVNGTVTGATLTMKDGSVVINGNVTMTGNVYIGSSGSINGDLKAYDVTTHSSNATVNGNAAVNSIYLDWSSYVTKTITCTGAAPGAPVCSCVTKADSSYKPSCGAAPAGGAHHVQITHSGTALTCQPQTVTLTACANANCTAPHYSGSVTGTLSPGNLPFTIAAGNGLGNGLVQQVSTTPDPALLSATSNATNGYSCILPGNTTNPCAMTFRDKGLEVKIPDHVSMATNISLTIQALAAQNGNQSCVPLLKKQLAVVNIGCGFSVPANSAVSGLTLTGSNGSDIGVSCGNSASAVTLYFDDDGKASARLKYPEVGTLTLNAQYTASSPAFYAVGDTSFTVAPASIKMTAARVNATPVLPTGVFARAGEPFKITLTALNSDGNTTKNFGTEYSANAKENFLFNNAISIPDPAVAKGTIERKSTGSIKDGSVESVWSFSDVGTIKIGAGIDRPTGGYYMDKPVSGFNPKVELTLGRFIPDHFDTMLPVQVAAPATPAYSELSFTQIAGVTMKCSDASSYNNPCVALDKVNGRFIYSKQPFYLVVKAYNMQSQPTENYNTGGLAKPVTLTSWTELGKGQAVGSMQWSGAGGLTFAGGVAVVDAASLPYFDFNGAGPFDPTSIYVRATESTGGDGVTSARATGAIEIPLTAVAGRLQVGNSYGSQNSPMPVQLQALYYASNAGGYVSNPAFNSVAMAIAGSDYSLVCKTASCGTLAIKSSQLQFVAGKASIMLAPPLASGSAELRFQPVDWIKYLPSATGRETWGIYRSGPVIYTREVHN